MHFIVILSLNLLAIAVTSASSNQHLESEGSKTNFIQLPKVKAYTSSNSATQFGDLFSQVSSINKSDKSLDREANTDKIQFRIGLIVPKTSFLSQYKTYTQRIRDTFSHLLQSSRHQQSVKLSNLKSGGSVKSISQQSSDTKTQTTSSCQFNSNPTLQKFYPLPWPNLTFNQHFDIKVVDLVNLASRSSAQDIIDSMCTKLIEQNVSVIIYLENNQDQTVASLETPLSVPTPILTNSHKSLHVSSDPSVSQHQSNLKIPSNDNRTTSTSRPNQLENVDTVRTKQSTLVSSYDRGPSGMHQSGSQAHFIMHLAHSAGIPMITWSVTATLAQRPKKQRALHLAPTVAHEAKAMLAIMDRYSWHSFSVVSTTLAGHDDFILALRQFMVASNGDPSLVRSSNMDSSSSPSSRSYSSRMSRRSTSNDGSTSKRIEPNSSSPLNTRNETRTSNSMGKSSTHQDLDISAHSGNKV